jgi:hypothetical protein
MTHKHSRNKTQAHQLHLLFETPMSTTVRIQVSACALSATVNNLRYRSNYAVSTNSFKNNRFSIKPLRVSMSSVPPSEPFEVAVKASLTTPNKLGDCKKTHPFHFFFLIFSVLSFFFVLIVGN